MCVGRTDHEVGDAAENDGRDRPQSDDVRQHLTQEVHRHTVIPADVLVTEEENTHRGLLTGTFKYK